MLKMNKRAQAGEVTLRELVITVGFFGGIWLAIGINPETEILKAFTGILVDLEVSLGYIFFLNILPIIVFIGTLLLIFQLGGRLGLAAVTSAFLGGLLIIVTPILSVVFLLIGLGLGSIAEG